MHDEVYQVQRSNVVLSNTSFCDIDNKNINI